MDEQDRRVAVTAFISAIVEGIRDAGRVGLPQDGLYEVLSGSVDRGAFDMIVEELIAQKTIKRGANRMLIYCGPSVNRSSFVVAQCQMCTARIMGDEGAAISIPRDWTFLDYGGGRTKWLCPNHSRDAVGLRGWESPEQK